MKHIIFAALILLVAPAWLSSRNTKVIRCRRQRPNSNWSMQVSHGFLKNPEALEPGDVRRTTASISYNKPFERGNWASSLIWGRNHEAHDGEIFNLNGYVAESTVKFLDRNYFYTRLELADKTSYSVTPIAAASASPSIIRLFVSAPIHSAARAIFGIYRRRRLPSAAT